MTEDLRRFKAEIFQALAHPTRIAIVELLSRGEMSAGQINQALGLEQANGSQHLAVLRARHVVTSRKEGNLVFYGLRDSALIEVLNALKRYFYSQIAEAKSALAEMQGKLGTDPPFASRGE